LLATAARPGEVEAATVDHGLRVENAEEARMVAHLCERLDVPHATLSVTVPSGASLQAQAREARYAALADWARSRELSTVLTAHHADDQAETLLMRLARGSGLPGLSGIRAASERAGIRVVRPLLGWTRSELARIVAEAGLRPVDDPANRDPRHDRTGIRELLVRESMLDPLRLAASAAHLGEAEEALSFAARGLFSERCAGTNEGLSLKANDLPHELQRRLLLLAFAKLEAPVPRGLNLDRAIALLSKGGTCTLSGLKLSGGDGLWRISPEPRRR
jgi:tRNA(Ile)-lysidine synthase